MSAAPHILIIDDHAEIRDALQRYLEKVGMRVAAVESGREMDRMMIDRVFDLVILDIMLPGEDGLSICHRLRAKNNPPVLMLSALGDDTDRIVGLELGADDYIAKPFNPREVVARIRAILRRSVSPTSPLGGANSGKILGFAAWKLHIDRRCLVDISGTETFLTSADFQLLLAFLERPRVILSRDRLLELTSGRSSGPFDRAIDNQVSRLRRKIERDPSRPELIITVRGGGYSLASDVIEQE